MKTNDFFILSLRINENELGIPSYSFVDSNQCILTTPSSRGNHYLDYEVLRSNIIDKQPGTVLLIGFKLVNIHKCQPIQGAICDLWQCNAFGEYSGFGEYKNERFLRGRQISDNLGFVEYTSIYPSYYDNRTNHLHLKINYQNKDLLTTQLYFPQIYNNEIQKTNPYNKRPLNKIQNRDDHVLKATHFAIGCWLKTISFGNKIMATITIALNI